MDLRLDWHSVKHFDSEKRRVKWKETYWDSQKDLPTDSARHWEMRKEMQMGTQMGTLTGKDLLKAKN